MRVRELMTDYPVCCDPQMLLGDVARLMVDHDCGDIPVVESGTSRRPIGVITDRDIVCRAVAEGRNPLELRAEDCMSTPVISVTPDTDIEDCCRAMEEHQIRRVPVVDEAGSCCGVVSQADIARAGSRKLAGEVVKEISRPTSTASRIG
jgi:CBS domain-containing protein